MTEAQPLSEGASQIFMFYTLKVYKMCCVDD